jgi:hypothetical protein
MSKQSKPTLIVFGKRLRQRPRAAWFSAADAAVARWIAQRHGLSTLKATTRVLNELGNPIAEWQLVPRGEPILPTIRLDTFDQLQALADEARAGGEAAQVAMDATEGSVPAVVTVQQREAARTLWSALAIGTLVLAQEDNPEHGWWEAIILAMHHNTCTLCWRDHPEDGLARREGHQLAILHPGD